MGQPLSRQRTTLIQRWYRRLGQRCPRWVHSKMLLIMLGGAVGCYLRYAISRWINQQPWGQFFPFGTLVVNVVGCFILAVAAVIILEHLPPAHQDWYLLIGTGFCGGFTTFSTFGWETYKLLRDGSWSYAVANILGSCLAGLAAIMLAVTLTAMILPKK